MDGSFLKKLEEIITDAMVVVDKDGNEYSKLTLTPLTNYISPTRFDVHTLTGLIDFINLPDHTDKTGWKIFINNYASVTLFGAEHIPSRQTPELVRCDAQNLPLFPFNEYLQMEEMAIKLQTHFVSNEDSKSLTMHISKVDMTDGITIEDDGVSQSTTIKKGLSGVVKGHKEAAPRIVKLNPYMTFLDIEQPGVSCLFRLTEWHDKVPRCGLFLADGGSWKLELIQKIKNWLKERTDLPVIA